MILKAGAESLWVVGVPVSCSDSSRKHLNAILLGLKYKYTGVYEGHPDRRQVRD
jgi:hypothetical protein